MTSVRHRRPDSATCVSCRGRRLTTTIEGPRSARGRDRGERDGAAVDRRSRCRLARAERIGARRSRAHQHTSVYTPARVFPMLPEALSNDRTSLNQSEDRPGAGRRHGGCRRWDGDAVGGLSRGGAEPRAAHVCRGRRLARRPWSCTRRNRSGRRPRAPAADPGSPGRVPAHAARGRRRAGLRPHRDQAGDGRRRSQGPAGRRLEPCPRHDRELHDRRQRRDRAVPDLAGLGLDPARRASAETVAAHRRDRRRARHHAARRARRRRTRSVPARAAGGAARDLSRSVAEHPQTARPRRVRRRESRRWCWERPFRAGRKQLHALDRA